MKVKLPSETLVGYSFRKVVDAVSKMNTGGKYDSKSFQKPSNS